MKTLLLKILLFIACFVPAMSFPAFAEEHAFVFQDASAIRSATNAQEVTVVIVPPADISYEEYVKVFDER